jgi:electron transfer flavoprotein beta subunit
MRFDIIVCIKQVVHPDYLGKVSLDSETGTIDRSGAPAVINPVDKNALEEAIRIRQKLPGRIIVLTMGPPQARKALEEALAMGADEAVLLCDPVFAGADTLATARALASGIEKIENFALVLCGSATIDSGTGQVPVQLAEFLDLPCVTNADELTIQDEQTLLVRRAWEHGYIRARAKLPAVVAVTDKINQPHLPGVLDIMAATGKEIREWRSTDIGVPGDHVGLIGSPTRFYQIGEFHAARQGVLLTGSPAEVLDWAIQRLVELEML